MPVLASKGMLMFRGYANLAITHALLVVGYCQLNVYHAMLYIATKAQHQVPVNADAKTAATTMACKFYASPATTSA
jgi:hypothetical protein